MRYLHIFQYYLTEALNSRGENIVYFLLSFINPIISVIFWRGAYGQSTLGQSGWQLPELLTYYLLLITVSAVLITHIEWVVGHEDIYQGQLTPWLLKPFSYFLSRFFNELPWRLIQGSFGILFFLCYVLVFHGTVSLVSSPTQIIAAIIVSVLGFCISFFMKMILGLTAFWTTDFTGLQNLMEVITVIFAGFTLPLFFFPSFLQPVILSQPFAYIIYMPLLAWIGKIPLGQIPHILYMQIFWLLLLSAVAYSMWHKGVQKYTGVGN